MIKFVFLLGFFVHIVYLWSIFDVYYTSPIISNLQPHHIAGQPPANRLVLFVADGLRAHSFFELCDEGKLTAAPFLRNTASLSGRWGVCHSSLPTESRPGHVALLAGLYEDVSAVTRGWKENPVSFDSLLNSSSFSWSWGSPDIVPMFVKGSSGNHVFMSTYSSSLQDFGGTNSSMLDTWVFVAVSDFLKECKQNDTLNRMIRSKGVVFFLHLLGLDTIGHGHKPRSTAYCDALRVVDRGVKEIFQLFEDMFAHDNRTAYIFTADHGMTDWGSHGAGDDHETMVPFVAWGSGISKTGLGKPQMTSANWWHLNSTGRTDLIQVDVAPLMSALIGVPIPVNSVGKVPIPFLNVSKEYMTAISQANFRQACEQFLAKRREKMSTTFSLLFREAPSFGLNDMQSVEDAAEKLIAELRYQDATQLYLSQIPHVFAAVTYFHRYERFILSGFIAAGFLMWILLVLTVTAVDATMLTFNVCTPCVLGSVLLLAMSFVLWLQSLPLSNYVYCLLPVYLLGCTRKVLKTSPNISLVFRSSQYTFRSYCFIILYILGTELLVLSFFYRPVLSVVVCFVGLWPFTVRTRNNSITWKTKVVKILWLVSSVTCSLLLFLPPALAAAPQLDLVILCGSLASIALLTLCLSNMFYYTTRLINRSFVGHCCVLVCTTVTTLNIYAIRYQLGNGNVVPVFCNILSWTLLLVAGSLLLLNTSESFFHRFHYIASCLYCPYLLMSINYDAVFYAVLAIHCALWVLLESSANVDLKEYRIKTTSILLNVVQCSESTEQGINVRSCEDFVVSLRRAYFVVVFMMFAFFGAGNVASVNSFNPSVIRSFITVFNPFVMSSLLLVKIALPFLIASCTVCGLQLLTGCSSLHLFLLILVFCDLMSLNFLFLLKEVPSSWLDIGTSISHFVIAMVMTLILFVFHVLAKVLTRSDYSRKHERYTQ